MLSRGRIIGRASGPQRGRRRRGSTGCSAGDATRRAQNRGRAHIASARRSRTASTRGGTCTLPERAPRTCSGTSTRLRFPDISRARLSEDLLDPVAQPVGVATLRLRQRGTNEQNVVRPAWNFGQELAPRFAEPALDPVPGHGAADLLRHGDSEPRLTVALAFAVEAVEHEEARRHGAAMP